jgi:hypothetical protein
VSGIQINQMWAGLDNLFCRHEATPFIEENPKIGNIGFADELNDVG